MIRQPAAAEGDSLPDIGVGRDSEMVSLPIIWLMLAVTVTLLAMKTKSGATELDSIGVEAKESGHGIALVAVVYSLALLAGFLFVSKFLISNL